MKDKLILFVAQGFGVGRIPFAPGTFGSVVGLGWFALLLATGNIWLFALGTILGLAASVWFCGEAEKILGQTDPGSVVLDEIAAIPVCFGVWVGIVYDDSKVMPSLDYLLSQGGWMLLLGVFFFFRLFDIWKPWPIRQSQKFPGGWGVTIDDILAAVYVNVCLVLFICALIYLTAGDRRPHH
ncbi:MAG: phosphatidylglycerophosphatase A [Verrucomicrobia bacterium]|nr:phosphatidylglycerophosphatase A [Verrucomicrobiota bacterium]